MRSALVVGFAVACTAVGAAAQVPADTEVFTVKASFAEARGLLEAAIEGRGLKIDRFARVGEMLDRTGADVGSAKRLYANAEVAEFCSATLSRRMMEANPHNLVHCPYTIAVYALVGETGRAYIAIRKLPARPELEPVAKLLREIATEAAQ